MTYEYGTNGGILNVEEKVNQVDALLMLNQGAVKAFS